MTARRVDGRGVTTAPTARPKWPQAYRAAGVFVGADFLPGIARRPLAGASGRGRTR